MNDGAPASHAVDTGDADSGKATAFPHDAQPARASRPTPQLGIAGIDANGETAAEHLRNALQLLRLAFDCPTDSYPRGTLMLRETEGVQRRVTAALALIEGDAQADAAAAAPAAARSWTAVGHRLTVDDVAAVSLAAGMLQGIALKARQGGALVRDLAPLAERVSSSLAALAGVEVNLEATAGPSPSHPSHGTAALTPLGLQALDVDGGA
jgi:hypothetical protein